MLAQILAVIMRLRRTCCNPRLVMPESPIESAKLRTFGAIVDELRENRHKALVFSQFVGHLALIREHLDDEGSATSTSTAPHRSRCAPLR